jgi:hypothetical protein
MITSRKMSLTHPDDDSPWLVVGTNLEIRAFGDMVPKEFEQVFRFLDFVTNNSPGKPLVDVECFLARYWVSANDGVLLDMIESITGIL